MHDYVLCACTCNHQVNHPKTLREILYLPSGWNGALAQSDFPKWRATELWFLEFWKPSAMMHAKWVKMTYESMEIKKWARNTLWKITASQRGGTVGYRLCTWHATEWFFEFWKTSVPLHAKWLQMTYATMEIKVWAINSTSTRCCCCFGVMNILTLEKFIIYFSLV